MFLAEIETLQFEKQKACKEKHLLIEEKLKLQKS
jgi:hypothetical protein